MSKRKAGVNDIIYELDNDDIEISSEDEVKEPKINRLETQTTEVIEVVECEIKESSEEPIPVDISEPTIEEKSPQESSSNGGKIAPDSSATSDEVISIPASPNSPEIEKEPDEIKIDDAECTKTTIYNEDIVVDSPASNSDLGVVGCENRTPLLTVRFRDKKLASTYKKKLKTFMLRLIKIHEKEPSPELESETDIELDIWPEDLNDDEDFEVKSEDNTQENLFFIDTDPCLNQPIEIPTYKNVSTLISNRKEEEEPAAPVFRRGPKCFNCDGDHQLRDCVLPKNNARIAEKRKNMTTRVGRYHVEDEQKYGHLIPGRISGPLRHALGLKRNELPLHIYRMRILGYPPGWLEEARISHSGITMFDSSGAATLDPEEEEGEVSEPGSRDKFDIKKILDFPGFNVPASSRYVEEGHLLGLPPMSEQDSKITMLQMLAPNAMKAYKRKKLTLFPSAANTSAQEVAEMELDSGDEVAEFPSVPPLPDEAPPPPPPVQPPPPPESPPPLPPDTPTIHSNDKEKPEEVCNRNSPSLDDLEEKKKLLLDALVGEDVGSNMSSAGDTNNEMDDSITLEEVEAQLDEALNSKNKDLIEEIADCSIPDIEIDNVSNAQEVANVSPQIETVTKDNFEKVTSTPESKTGHVKTTLYGTPVMNIASSYVKLPSDDKFAKDICDVINFENLPNSTGKYKKICNVLKRVKSEVDRIQES